MIGWGVVGPGAIATKFAEDMQVVDGGVITAVASRSHQRADHFGDRFSIPARYASYEALAEDPAVDVVYVATPHAHHERDTLMALEAGKHVLCEKPLALSARQTRRMVEAARARQLFLMEALWSRFLPAYRALVEVVGEGRIGEPMLVEADFGFRREVEPEHRLFNRELGGGALLDLGIYPVQLCSLLLGAPEYAAAAGAVGETGVDEQVAAVLRHAGGKLGVVKAAITVSMSCTGRVSGTDGAVTIPAFMHCPTSISVASSAGVEEIDASFAGNGLRFEIEAVQACLAEGRTESSVMPLDESVVLAETLDAIRSQIGVVYPGE